MRTRVKVCCIGSAEEARVAVAAGADALGLVSAMPSGPGVIDEALIADIAAQVPPPVATFLLTSRTDADGIIEQARHCRTTAVQLVDRVETDVYGALRRALPGMRLVQVVHVGGDDALAEAVAVAAHVDAVLLDSGRSFAAVRELGGTGRVHDWQVSRRIVERLRVPVFLAGGLNAENIAEAIRQVLPFGVDVCSGVRTDGLLDGGRLRRFVEAVADVRWRHSSPNEGGSMQGSLSVVFVHSLAGSPEQWAPQVEHFEPHRPVVAATLPGHAGRAEPEAYSIEALAAGVEREVADLDRFVLVGHSAGALAAIHLAASHPDRVAGLVLVDPGTDARQFPAEQTETMLAALRSDAYEQVAEGYYSEILEGATEATRHQVLADLRATSREALPGVLSSMGSYDAVTPLREYAASRPVLALTTPASEGPHALFASADSVEQRRIDETSHWVQLDAPDVVNRAIDRFLRRVESEGIDPGSRKGR